MRDRHFLLYALLCLTVVPKLPAQTRASLSRFDANSAVLGPTVGIGGIGEASLSIGGRYEKGVKPLPDLGNGVLAFGGLVNYYRYSSGAFGTGSSSFTFVQFAGTANYHFRVEDARWDPFLGLGLGYTVANVTGLGSASSGLFAVGFGGARYFFNPKTAIQVDLGAGSSVLNVGLMFRL